VDQNTSNNGEGNHTHCYTGVINIGLRDCGCKYWDQSQQKYENNDDYEPYSEYEL
jgi:hypothetical protein